MEDINNQTEELRMNYAIEKYGKYFPDEIIKYFLTRHCNQYYCFNEFDFIDLEKCSIQLATVTSDEIFTKLDYAKFCSLKNETKQCYDSLSSTGYNYWPYGSWSAPIIVAELNNNYLAIDGNNRLRMLRIFLKFSKGRKSKTHKLFIIK
jgi:hypothetical protein